MKLLDKLYVIEKMIRLIEWERTGNATDLSNSLGISRSQLFIEIDELKSLDVDIHYSRAKNSYVFSGNKTIQVREPLLVIDRTEQKEVNGGYRSKSTSIGYFSHQAQQAVFR
jgi:hypothetical protein